MKPVQGFLSSDLNWVVPKPEAPTLEMACKQMLGKATWDSKTFWTLSVSQLSEALGMINGGWPPELVLTAKSVLERWGWFREAGLASVPPWEVDEARWLELERIRPWNKSGQELLF